MADFLKLNDGTFFEIEEGASIGNIIYEAADNADGLRVAGAVTKENVQHVEFFSNTDAASVAGGIAVPSGVYDNLGLTSVYFDVENLKVLISLYEKSALELRVDDLEDSLELTNEALDAIIMGF